MKLGCELRSDMTDEKARDRDGKLSNWLTGRRFVYITVPRKPLNKFMKVGIFQATVSHKEQPKLNARPKVCGRCLREGHGTASCVNDIICRECLKPGHKRGDPLCEAIAENVEQTADRDQEGNSSSSSSESEEESEAECEGQPEPSVHTPSAAPTTTTAENAGDANADTTSNTTSTSTTAVIDTPGESATVADNTDSAVEPSQSNNDNNEDDGKKKKKKNKKNGKGNENRGREKGQTTLPFPAQPRSESAKRVREEGDSPKPEDKVARTS